MENNTDSVGLQKHRNHLRVTNFSLTHHRSFHCRLRFLGLKFKFKFNTSFYQCTKYKYIYIPVSLANENLNL